MTGRGAKGTKLDEAAVRALCGEEIARWGLRGKRVLAIVPDHTRTRADRPDVPRAARADDRAPAPRRSTS